MNIWVYDFEVFQFDWIVTFKNNESGELITFHNDFLGLQSFYEEKIKYQSILVGYNNRFYDDYVLKAVLNNVDPWLMNDWIIVQKQTPWEFPPLRFKKNTAITYDVMQNMAIGSPVSLKQLEGYFGKKIFESQIPFDLDRPLNEEELKEVIDYNVYDVEMTDLVFNIFKAKFDGHLALIEMYDMEPKFLGYSAATKTAAIMKASHLPKYKTFNYELPQKIKHLFDPNDEVVSNFVNSTFYVEKQDRAEHPFSFSKQMNDFVFDFALGGGHGAIPCYQYKGKIWNLDVKSYYVSLMVEFNLMSRACHDGTQKIAELLQKRIALKNEGQTKMADALKMVLVTIYGAMAYDNNNLWDPKMQTSVCITGQLLLYNLTQRLQQYSKVIQINTDGIMIIPYDEIKCEEIYKQWEKDTGMELELDVGEEIYQKDVNNYIFVKSRNFDLNDKKSVDKNVKTKGSFVRFWNHRMSDDDFYQIANFTINNNMTIIDEAVVKKILFNIPIEQTIMSCNDLIRFQKIVKLMTGFTNLTVNDGESFHLLKNSDIYNWIDNDEIYHGKAYRMFFIENGKHFKKYKMLEDGDFKNDNIAGCSNSAIIYNGDVKNAKLNDVDFKIDYNHYIELANNVLKSYESNDVIIEE